MEVRHTRSRAVESMAVSIPFTRPEPETVLVAEDDDQLRELISCELRQHGLRVVEFEDGLELEDYLADSLIPGAHLAHPDLIVSEALMPGMGGLDVLRHLRAAHASTPFIVIAARDDEQAFEEAEELGAEYVVEKPVDLEDLTWAVLETEPESR